MIRTFLASLVLGGTLVGHTASALIATQQVEKEVTITNADGSQTTKRKLADMVMPGDKVVYSLEYYNDTATLADNIVIVMPVPTEVKYLEGTAKSNVAITSYSADKGGSFVSRDQLMVNLEDGSTRTAKSEDITHIRWKINGAIEAGSIGVLSFKGQLK